MSMGIRLMTGSALQSYSQWRSRRKLKEGAEDTEDAKESMVWSPAPIVYGIVNNNLLPSLSVCIHSPSFIPRMQLSSSSECDGVRGNQTKEWEQSAFSSRRSAPLLGCGESQADC